MGENIFEKPCSVFGLSVSFCSASDKIFYFGASLVKVDVVLFPVFLFIPPKKVVQVRHVMSTVPRSG